MDCWDTHSKAVTDQFDRPLLKTLFRYYRNKDALLTETMPDDGERRRNKNFKFQRLINTGKTMQASKVENYRYTVEFTSHPVWYVVQALPYLSQQRYPSARNIFNTFYSN